MPVDKTQPVYPPDPGKPVEADWGIAASEHVIQRFATIADRDAKWITPPVGAQCVTTSPSLIQWIFDGINWVPSGGVLISEMKLWPSTIIPPNWLVCDGRAISRTVYNALFILLGSGALWGAGDGSTTFNLPDIRGKAPIGAGTGVGLTARAVGQVVGSEGVGSHSHGINVTSGYMSADHSHVVYLNTGGQSANHIHETALGTAYNFIVQNVSGGPNAVQLEPGDGAVVTHVNTTNWAASDHYHTTHGSTQGASANHQHAVTGNTSLGGTGPANNNLQPSAVVNYIIYAGAA